MQRYKKERYDVLNCPVISKIMCYTPTKIAHFVAMCATFVISLQSLVFRRNGYYLVSSLDMKLHLQ